MRVCRSPWLFAAYHGLHRLRVPRHPPPAFSRLTLIQLAHPTSQNRSGPRFTRERHATTQRSARAVFSEQSTFFGRHDSFRSTRLTCSWRSLTRTSRPGSPPTNRSSDSPLPNLPTFDCQTASPQCVIAGKFTNYQPSTHKSTRTTRASKGREE